MVKKGICDTCVYDRWCVFPRNFPVLQCEEFVGYSCEPKKAKKTRHPKKKFT